MKNNKGFSLIELLGAITILGVITALALITYTRYIEQSRKKSYKMMRESAISATEEYLLDHPENTNVSITFKELVDGEYLENASDPSDTSIDCKGKVTVIENASTDSALASNDYEVIMCCANYYHTYNTKTKEDTTNSECTID